MKIALKYGLLITLCFIAWVVVAHLLVPDPHSHVHDIGAGTFVNIVEVLAIFLGIKAKRSENAQLTFKDGLKTGVGVAFVYGISSSLFFIAEMLVLGPKILAGHPGAEIQPIWQVVLGAFLGLFGGALLFGLLYSTIISFVFAVRQRR